MWDKVKEHVKEHKEEYILGGIVLAGITLLVMKGRYARMQRVLNGSDKITMHPFGAKPTYWAHQPMQSPPTGHIGFTFSDIQDSFNNNVINVLEREGRGHPGYMIRCVENELTYVSQKQAALAFDVSPKRISDHMNGRLADVDGYHFERIVLAA